MTGVIRLCGVVAMACGLALVILGDVFFGGGVLLIGLLGVVE
jgi:hypothetical protein